MNHRARNQVIRELRTESAAGKPLKFTEKEKPLHGALQAERAARQKRAATQADAWEERVETR